MRVAIDDATRLAYVRCSPTRERSPRWVPSPSRQHYASYGVTVERLITDNGSAYRAAVHAMACRALGIRQLRTHPYRPPNQRQSRTVHPHHARRLGLRRDTATATNETPPSPAGWTSTIAADHTAPSATSHP